MMKVPLLVASLALAAAPLEAPDGSLRLTPPLGWTAAEARPPVVFRLVGPLRTSALVSRLEPTQYLYNRAALSRSLERLLDGVAREAGITLELDPKLRHASLSNGAEVDYRLGRAAGRPSLLLGICRFDGQVLLVQVISHHAEPNLREIAGALEAPRRQDPPPARREEFPPMRTLVAFWAAVLLGLLLAMLYWALQLRKPSRFQREKPSLRR